MDKQPGSKSHWTRYCQPIYDFARAINFLLRGSIGSQFNAAFSNKVLLNTSSVLMQIIKSFTASGDFFVSSGEPS